MARVHLCLNLVLNKYDDTPKWCELNVLSHKQTRTVLALIYFLAAKWEQKKNDITKTMRVARGTVHLPGQSSLAEKLCLKDMHLHVKSKAGNGWD